MQAFLPRSLSALDRRRLRWRPSLCRPFTATTSTTTSTTTTTTTPPMRRDTGATYDRVLHELDRRLAPSAAPSTEFPLVCIPVRGERVRVLDTPAEFYQQLRSGILRARSRIVMATLYLGTDAMEKQLVADLRGALCSQPELRVHFLLDYLRGTRGSPEGCSSVGLLQPLVDEFPERCRVSLYHTPDLHGWKKRWLPARFNEGIGLNHIKAYLFDDDVVWSGANLSSLYFQNRQDRYILFENQPTLTDYTVDLMNTLAKLSFQLKPCRRRTNKVFQEETTEVILETHPPSTTHPTDQPEDYKNQAHKLLSEFLQRWTCPSILRFSDADTILLPTIQMGCFGIRQDERTMHTLLELLQTPPATTAENSSPWTVHVTSGYFNFTEQYQQLTLASQSPVHIITASPLANGFYGSAGLSKYIPDAYTWIAHEFLEAVRLAKKENSVQVYEYHRDGWTYHAKGLWMYPEGEALPMISCIGSPNFGYRSSERDLEAQVFIITRDKELRSRLHENLQLLYDGAQTPLSPEKLLEEHQPRGWVRTMAKIIKTML